MCKQFFSILLCCMIFGLPVQAETVSISLIGVGATVSLPDGWEKVASSKEEILLEAEGPGGILMTLTCQEGEVSQGQWNLSLYEESECDDLGESIAETLEKGGYENVQYSLYPKDPVTWLCFRWERQDKGEARSYGVQYYTAMNGKSITVAFSSEAAIEEDSVTEIVDSVIFDQVLDRPEAEDHSWETRIIWIVLLIAAGLLTYAITKKRGKR